MKTFTSNRLPSTVLTDYEEIIYEKTNVGLREVAYICKIAGFDSYSGIILDDYNWKGVHLFDCNTFVELKEKLFDILDTDKY